jgi:hypothetical protein
LSFSANGKSFKWKVIDKDKLLPFVPGLLIEICPSPSNKPAKYEPRYLSFNVLSELVEYLLKVFKI